MTSEPANIAPIAFDPRLIVENITRLRRETPTNVTLIAVSKQQPPERVKAALDSGWRVFGENKLQEAETRWVAARPLYPDLQLHFVGQLQSNKADKIVALFDAIHSLDRPSAINAVAKACEKLDRRPQIFLQINTGGEAQKGGLAPNEITEALALCTTVELDVSGLMVLPPADQAPAPHFALAKNLSDTYGLPHVSMGMSGDYQTAIALGATHVRLGTAFFGPRPTPKAS